MTQIWQLRNHTSSSVGDIHFATIIFPPGYRFKKALKELNKKHTVEKNNDNCNRCGDKTHYSKPFISLNNKTCYLSKSGKVL